MNRLRILFLALPIFLFIQYPGSYAFAKDYLGHDISCNYGIGDDISYDEIRRIAIRACPLRKSTKVNVALIDDLISIEKNFVLPSSVRGLLLSAACSESGYNPKARGDYRKSKKTKRKIPKAHGLLQFWPWAKKYIDRDDPLQSANFWLQRIKRQIPFVKKRCRFKNKRKIWFASHVTAVRAPKKTGRCYESSRHHRLLKKWHRLIISDRKVCHERMLDGDGC